MARGLKSQGRVELDVLLRRVRRQRAMGRINEEDARWLDDALCNVDAYIVRMEEKGEDEYACDD